MNKLDKNFWETKYNNNDTGWNIGYPSMPIKTYIDQLTDKDLKILIPGAGNSYEAEYLYRNGFRNVFVLDITEEPLKNLKNRIPDFPDSHLIQGDFFKHIEIYDLIIEQTFFCSLSPILRESYAEKMNQLLKSGGKLVGLLFEFELTKQGPPFGGSLNEYNRLFSKYFDIKILEPSYNSIESRQGKELFIIFEKTKS